MFHVLYGLILNKKSLRMGIDMLGKLLKQNTTLIGLYILGVVYCKKILKNRSIYPNRELTLIFHLPMFVVVVMT